jgi:hypothetical protein
LRKNPGVNHLDAVRAPGKAAFVTVRQGKHIVMSNGARILAIRRHTPANAFTLGGMVPDAGLRRSSFCTCCRKGRSAQAGVRAHPHQRRSANRRSGNPLRFFPSGEFEGQVR